VHDIRHGDVILTPQSKKPAVVIRIEAAAGAPGLAITVEYRHGRRPPYPEYTYLRHPADKMMVERGGPCGREMCAEHAREVAEGRHYCAACWRAWEAVT
jgi:hypothetical protein